MNDSRLFVNALDGLKTLSQQSNEKSLMMENLQLLGEITTKLARTDLTWRIEAGALNRRSMLERLMHFALVLIL